MSLYSLTGYNPYATYGYSAWGGYPVAANWSYAYPAPGYAVVAHPDNYQTAGSASIVKSLAVSSIPTPLPMRNVAGNGSGITSSALLLPKSNGRDIWKNSPLRYLGYLNEVGESWTGVLDHCFGKKAGNRLYKGSYYISGLYTLGDIFGNGYRAYKESEGHPTHTRISCTLAEVGEAGLFQIGAGYVIPALIVKYLREGLQHLMKRIPVTNRYFPAKGLGRVLLPALISSAIIPLMVKPIDNIVQTMIRQTYWKALKEASAHRPSDPYMQRYIDENYKPAKPISA